ncbi:MAG TPA: hypothetical protein VFM82_02755 [Flavobacteriaceae bacterium]|nr:hypothetical protein [Flavobacteriaceae bacterium]
MNELLNNLKKPLEIEQIDFRIQSISKKGFATILAYKDARTDMNRLDEVCGALWQDKYELIDNQLFCSIGIKIENEWVWRQDVGIESNTEATKGRASDAFKRAGFRWGIGRELYDYPRIQMSLRPDEFTEYNGKGKQTFNLKLDKWKWNIERKDGKITKLTAHDEKGALRYDSTKDYNSAPSGTQAPPKSQAQTQSPQQPKQATSNVDDNKKWLNKMSGKDFTKEWLNILQGIGKGTVKSVLDVRKYYKVSEEIEKELDEVFGSPKPNRNNSEVDKYNAKNENPFS